MNKVLGFPGQGVRWDGVLARLAELSTATAVRHLSDMTGVHHWSSVDPADTALAQPAILAASLAVATTHEDVTVLTDRADGTGAVIAGHSFGELAALATAGVIGIEDALALAVERGRLGAEVHREVGGAMLAVVGLPALQVERLRRFALHAAGGTCEVAVRNHDTQIVLSGSPETLVVIEKEAAMLRGRAHVLPIGGPYHTPHMVEAASQYARAVAQVELRPPRWPVVLSTTERIFREGDDVDDLPACLGDSLVLPVDWPRTLKLARMLGAEKGLDVGPGNLLARIGRRAGIPFRALWKPPA